MADAIEQKQAARGIVSELNREASPHRIANPSPTTSFTLRAVIVFGLGT
jgi:hypothetical protein